MLPVTVFPSGRSVRRYLPLRGLFALLLVLVAAAGVSAQGSSTQDINGDGMVDAVFTQKQRYNQVCFGDGTGAFTSCTDLMGAGQFTISNQINTTSSVLVDWDKDGDLDIALAMEGHENVMCFNDGGGQFNAGLGCVPFYGYSLFPYFSEKVVTGDIDGDGNPDLVYANGGNAGLSVNQPNLVCFGYGSITADCHAFGNSAASTGLALGDFDADGKLDIVVSNRGSQNEVCLNRGRTASGLTVDCRAITSAAEVSSPKNSNAVAVGHIAPYFFGPTDGNLDIAFANDGRNEICMGTGDWSGVNVGLTCYVVNEVSSNLVPTDKFARTVDVAIANFQPQYQGNEIAFINQDHASVWCNSPFFCSFAFNVTDANAIPIIDGAVGVAIQDINMAVDNGLKWPEVVVANAAITRTYTRFYTVTTANSTLHPSSITLSGGTVGPTIDTTPPAFFGATDVTAEATGAAGAAVTFNVTALDTRDGSRPVTCNRVSGSMFAIGSTTVTCTASDLSGNNGSTSFTVTVKDTTGPVVTVPAGVFMNAPAGQTTAAVTFAVSALDAVNGSITDITCFTPSNGYGVTSGSQFPGGATLVTCFARDARLNYGEASFTVTVETDVDNDGTKDSIDTDDDGDGIADTIDSLPLTVSSSYYLTAQTEGTVTRNGWRVSIAPTASGSLYALRASVSGAGTAPAVITAWCGGGRKELRLDAANESIDWRCEPANAQGTRSLTAKSVSGTPEFWKVISSAWEKIALTNTNGATAGSPVVADPTNTNPIVVTIYDEALNEIGSFTLEPSESVDVNIVPGPGGANVLQLELLNGGVDGVVNVTLFGNPIELGNTGPATFSLTPPPPVTLPEIFRRTTATAEGWKKYTVAFTPPASGDYVLGFNIVDAAPSPADNSILIDRITVASNSSPVFADGFESPALAVNTSLSSNGGTATIGNWLCQNYCGLLNSSPPNWGLAAQGLGTADGTKQYAYLQAVNNTLGNMHATNPLTLIGGQKYYMEFYQASRRDFGGALTYTVTLDAVIPPDHVAPAIEVADITAEATGSTGASVSYSVSAIDDVDGPVTATCQPGSGSTFALHTTTVNCTAIDAAGNEATAAFNVTVVDSIAPVVSVPSSITAEANSADGAAVNYADPTATDAVGVVSVSANPPSGSIFPLGTTTVTAAAHDAAGNVGAASFTVSVVDTTAPVLTVPADQTIEAVDAAGAVASFSASATDAVGATVSYSQDPGTVFPIGTTTVTVTATDAAGNSSTGDFTIRVRDTIAPVLTVPADQVLEATSAAGAAANFAATATDAVGVTAVNYSIASGSTFAIGTTTVNVSAHDAAGNVTKGTFTITVRDTTSPVLDVPGNQVLEAAGAAGTVASFSASATDAVGATVSYSQNPGTVFAIGTTTVTVTAKDAAGNTSTGTFTITVRDTVAPALSVPASQVLEAASAAGTAASFTAAATDAVGVTSLTYTTASGSVFPIGTTTVTVTAKDAAGNTSTGAFTITVRDTNAPSVGSVTTSMGSLWPPNHQMVGIPMSIASSDAVGITGYKVTGASSEPDNGLGDGDTANDIQITGSGTLNPQVSVRAERAGNGNGRTYTITVVAVDAAGNLSAPSSFTVSVPKSQAKK